MYRLYIGFRLLGEFDRILEAKQFAERSGLSGVFNLIGDNYRDSWYVPRWKELKDIQNVTD
ncbi:hypothetical protein D0T84_01360 [Dysgonomonas sp. 521]|uniref:hypothetical protein n=1 Tax=Dysgonomonas sp. 521 TaxID=2302932 RepID=UPI0013D16D6D|nr:hypothetical protein [Dysgonomonas sp. 521]NDV93565.1 hypothetical protein [Dysgonomonas sp. 521]